MRYNKHRLLCIGIYIGELPNKWFHKEQNWNNHHLIDILRAAIISAGTADIILSSTIHNIIFSSTIPTLV